MTSYFGILVFYSCIFQAFSLELINQWNFLNFDFPPDFDHKDFRAENTVFTGLEVTDNRLFLSIPRLRPGVPAALVTIPRNTPPASSPLLQAYPNWSFHSAGRGAVNCSGLISVYRTRTDSCNRLWVLDAGIMDSIDSFTRVCQPKILIFDLATDQVVRTIFFPHEVLRPASLFTNLVIDESAQGKCDSSFVYITDTIAPGLVVYDSIKDQAWRFTHPTMLPNPDQSNFDIVGDKFTFTDGIIGLAYSAQLATLFYQPLAADKIFSVPTAALRKGPPAELEELPVSVAGKKSSQGLGLAVNQADNTLYFAPLTETSVASWNIVTNEQRLLAHDPINLQFTAELRCKEDGSLWLLSSKFHKFFKRSVSPNDINLRIMRIPPVQDVFRTFGNRFYY